MYEYRNNEASSAATRTNRVASAPNAYRTLWRWHFYAGLFVMPFLTVLAVTGTIYCFQPQIEPLLYPHKMFAEPQDTGRLAPDELLNHARAALPRDAVALSLRVSNDPLRSTELVFKFRDGSKQSVFLSPYTGAVLGTLSVENRFMQVDRMIHRKLLLGRTGELLMELAACWTLVMIGTGVAMWWPRENTSARDALLPRLTLTGRPFWKNLHAVIGIWLAVGALFFVLTGLPWSGFWGKQFNALATRANVGTPSGAWGGLPLQSSVPEERGKNGPQEADTEPHGGEHHQEQTGTSGGRGMVTSELPLRQTPWAVSNSPVPDSLRSDGKPLALQRTMDLAASKGIVDNYDLVFPTSATGVYTLSSFPGDPKLEHTIYIDQYSGAVIKDIEYQDYGSVAQAVSYGTSLHMGRYFGFWNQLLCALISMGLATMAITGFIMWWKRRPQRGLGAPVRDRLPPPLRAWKTGLLLLGAIFPLMGLSMLAVWALDRLFFSTDQHHTSL